MRLLLLLLASMLVAGPAAAQEGKPSSAPSAEDAKPSGPVSLERIREGLSAGPSKLTLSALEKPPDFKVEVQERHHLEEILATLDFKTGPVPAGGLYMYEQQRQLSNPVDRPLAQPYAAFSPGELITIAVENLIYQVSRRPSGRCRHERRTRARRNGRAARGGGCDREVLRGGSRTSEAPVNLHEVKL